MLAFQPFLAAPIAGLVVTALSACSALNGRVAAGGNASPSPASSATRAVEGPAALHVGASLPTAAGGHVVGGTYVERKSRSAPPAGRTFAPRSMRPVAARSNSEPMQAATAAAAPNVADRPMEDTAREPGSVSTIGSLSLMVPPSMTLDRRSLIRLAVRTREDEAYGVTRTASDGLATLGALFEARLSGDDFLIEPVSAPTQRVTSSSAEWTWLVTPRRPGQQRLHLATAEFGAAPGYAMRRALPTIEQSVHVAVPWQRLLQSRLQAHAEWLWIAAWAGAFALAWRYARWRKKRRRWFHAEF